MNILEFAINMELEGEKYYLKQADNVSDTVLKNIFMILAKDECNHAEILQKKSNNISFELSHNPLLSDTKNLFEGIKDFKSETKQIPEQLDLYREALDKEKESIDLYSKLLLEADDDESKTLYDFLLKQEKDHFLTLEELVSLLNRSNDWVEAAEFGIRPE